MIQKCPCMIYWHQDSLQTCPAFWTALVLIHLTHNILQCPKQSFRGSMFCPAASEVTWTYITKPQELADGSVALHCRHMMAVVGMDTRAKKEFPAKLFHISRIYKRHLKSILEHANPTDGSMDDIYPCLPLKFLAPPLVIR
jgi:hypothetical protein